MNFAGQDQILIRRQNFLAGVVVGHDKGTCIAENQNPENVARMNQAKVSRAAKDHFLMDDFHLRVEA